MQTRVSSRVGMIGLGAIGGIMARHLLAASYDVVGWDLRREALEPLVSAGGIAAESLAEIGSADVVLTLVFDDSGVEEVAFGVGGLIETMMPGSHHLILSTISPTLARRLHDAHLARGQQYTSAAMFGRPEAAAAAESFFTCSGERSGYDAVQPILNALGQPRWVGPRPEDAMMIKIIGNNMIHASVELLREMFDFLGTAGIRMEEAKESIVDRLFPGLIFQGYADRLIADPARPDRTHPMQMKDSNLCIAVARQAGVELPILELMHATALDRM